MYITVEYDIDPLEILALDGELAGDYLERRARELAINDGYQMSPEVGEYIGDNYNQRISFRTYAERDPDHDGRPMYKVQLRFEDTYYPRSGVE